MLIKNLWTRNLLVLLIVGFCVYAFVEKPPILGVDLDGGSELSYLVTRKGSDDTPLGVIKNMMIESLKKRLNATGMRDIRIQGGDREHILIQIPGRSQEEVDRVKEILKTQGRLEFRPVVVGERGERIRERLEQGRTIPRHRLMEYEEREGRVEKIVIRRDKGFEGHIKEARYNISPQYGNIVEFVFDAEGAKFFADITGELAREYKKDPKDDQRLAIILDDQVQSAPRVEERITGGRPFIHGSFRPQEARDLAIILQSGELPGRISLDFENTVGPSLGNDATAAGRFAILVSMALVFLFILTYYRFAGLVANVAIFLNLLITLGLLCGFGTTFTLPGIAGFALIVGMSIDANILIFERIREEMRGGTAVRFAIERGYQRAFVTILDANITTLITAACLYAFGSTEVQGFAATLILGIGSSMFTGIFFTRTVLEVVENLGLTYVLIARKGAEERDEKAEPQSGADIPRFMQIFGNPRYRFVKVFPTATFCSIVLVAVGVFFFSIQTSDGSLMGRKYRSIWDIDFSNGVLLQVSLRDRMSIGDIRGKIENAGYQTAEVQTTSAASGLSETSDFLVRVSTGQESDTGSSLDALDRLKSAVFGQFGERLGPMIVKVKTTKKLAADAVRDAVVKTYPGAQVFVNETGSEFEIRVPALEAATLGEDGEFVEKLTAAQIVTILSALGVSDKDVQAEKLNFFPRATFFSPSVAEGFVVAAVQAVLISMFFLLIYIAVRFEFRSAVAAVIALVHDVCICLGVFAIIHFFTPLEFKINLAVVSAIVTIIGYSLNDTIVVFDRIRENLKFKAHLSYAEIVNASINETLSRTVLTSLTTFAVAAVLFLIGGRHGGVLGGFALVLLIGVTAGTYSSIFVASPIIVFWNRFMAGKKEKRAVE